MEHFLENATTSDITHYITSVQKHLSYINHKTDKLPSSSQLCAVQALQTKTDIETLYNSEDLFFEFKEYLELMIPLDMILSPIQQILEKSPFIVCGAYYDLGGVYRRSIYTLQGQYTDMDHEFLYNEYYEVLEYCREHPEKHVNVVKGEFVWPSK